MEQALTVNAVETETPARRAERERAEAYERECALFDHNLTVLEESLRRGQADAPQRAQKFLEDQTVKVARVRQEARQLEDRLAYLRELQSQGETRIRRISAIMAHHIPKRTYQNVEGPTAETVKQPKRRDPVAILVEKGHLDHAHQAAAIQIAECYELACKAGMAKARDYAMLTPPPKNSGIAPDNRPPSPLDERHAEVYLPWTRRIGGSDLPFVFDIVVDGHSLDAATKYRRIGWDRGLDVLRGALELWGEISERRKLGISKATDRRPVQGPRSLREARTS